MNATTAKGQHSLISPGATRDLTITMLIIYKPISLNNFIHLAWVYAFVSQLLTVTKLYYSCQGCVLILSFHLYFNPWHLDRSNARLVKVHEGVWSYISCYICQCELLVSWPWMSVALPGFELSTTRTLLHHVEVPPFIILKSAFVFFLEKSRDKVAVCSCGLSAYSPACGRKSIRKWVIHSH